MKRSIYLTFLALFALTACNTTRGIIDPLTLEERAGYGLSAVQVKYNPVTAEKTRLLDEQALAKETDSDAPYRNQPLNNVLSQIVTQELQKRGFQGPKKANILIEIDTLKLASAMQSILIGDMDQLAGTVIVQDAATGSKLAEFYIDSIRGSSGLLGLAIRGSGVREKLSADFAKRIGDHFALPNAQNQQSLPKNRPANAGN
ncbi:MAG TPA: hypothetical protein PKX38_10085 [Alphaproteobacteria bacterium]|nr:hypothetical protein [Micavibrio sp.]MBK9561711.1 hypothetical protein [Micavibrio sp.]HQX28267.1 hypothetical protein [Alphaproteobacteria bacterium]